MRRSPRDPKVSKVMCRMNATERVTQVVVPTTVTPGTLLFSVPVNPTSSPRLAAVATQFDSWYGNVSMEVETTGNAFSQDYAILRFVPNGDASRLPTNARNLLNLAESCEERSQSAKLQLDSNRTASVKATWKTSYNPRKPILDPDPSECNNGLFILVADGSPGANAVNLTIRLKYDIHFYGPIATPVAVNSTQSLSGAGGTLGAANLLGSAPISAGPGSITGAANVIQIPVAGRYIITYYGTGTGLGVPTATISNGSFDTPVFTNVTSGTVNMATWNIVANAGCSMTLAHTATTLTTSYVQANPNVFAY